MTGSPPLLSAAELVAVRQYASGIGIDRVATTAEMVRAAHTAGLVVHVFTFDVTAIDGDYRAIFALGVDGIFTDCPDAALTARTR